jgi:hypothetical protein
MASDRSGRRGRSQGIFQRPVKGGVEVNSLTHAIAYGLVVTSIAGCAIKGNAVVSEPTGGALARVRIAALDDGPMGVYRSVRAYPNSSCRGQNVAGNGNVVNPTLGFEKTLNEQQRGMPATAVSQDANLRKAEIYVAASQPFALGYYRAETSSGYVIGNLHMIRPNRDSCMLSAQFTPEVGADYEVVFDALRACAVKAVQLTQSGGQVVKVSLPVQPAPVCDKR